MRNVDGRLYIHAKHPHTPRNVNIQHHAEQTGINQYIAVHLTRIVGTMWAAYTFIVLALIGLFAILGILSPTVALLVAWSSQTLIQLVMLPIIMVGQNVLGRRQELQNTEMYETSKHSFSDIEQIMAHLDAQDVKILHIVARMEHNAAPLD